MIRPAVLSAFLFFSASAQAAGPVFITIEKVELKSADGPWLTVIRPDRRVDLTQEEPAVRFFNNGRVVPGAYTNVRVSFGAESPARKRMFLERGADYSPPVAVKKGSFVGVTFSFDWEKPGGLSRENLREVRLVVDEDERVDRSDTIRLWS